MRIDGRERWLFTVELPADVPNPGRYVAGVLKRLLRTWGVKCIAVSESAELRRLQRLVEGLADRVAAQAELLARHAEDPEIAGATAEGNTDGR